MASTGSKVKKTSTESSAKKTTEKVNTEPENTVQDHAAEKTEYKVKKDLDPHMYVTVKNGFNGTLVYKSKRTGELFVWNDFGDEQEMELFELKTAKNTSKTFFVNNWFLFDDPEIIEWLGMSQYYKRSLNSASFDKLFELQPDEIERTIKDMPAGQRKSVAFRAKQLIADGKIDSMRVIAALEKSLSVELIER